MINNQGYIFTIFTLNGFLIGITFDFFRILRKAFKTKDYITYIEDIFFWIITGIIFLYSMYMFCDGELRLFMVIGVVIGILLYILTISKYVINVSVFIINILKKIISIPAIIVYKITKKTIFKPVSIICIKIRKKVGDFSKILHKIRGFFVKKENTIIE